MKLYRIESQKLKRSEIFYLVKDVRTGDSTAKVRIKLGYAMPELQEAERLTTTPNVELEVRALERRLERISSVASFLTADELQKIEETRFWTPLFKMFLSASEYEQVETLHEIEQITGTTAIEGNTLTAQQVEDLLWKGIAPQGKPVREQLEVLNAKSAADFRRDYGGKVSLAFIRRLHALMLDKINDQAGSFRRIDSVAILGEDNAVTPAILIETELDEAIRNYYSRLRNGANAFEEAVIFHERFEMIHPFIDGNGRVGRELLRHMLAQAGYPDVLIRRENRERYINALRDGHGKRTREMVKAFYDLLLMDGRADIFREILSKRTDSKHMKRRKGSSLLK